MHPPQPVQDSPQDREARRRQRRLAAWWGLGLLLVLGLAVWWWWEPLARLTQEWWILLQDKDAFRQRIESYGVWAPAVFILFQIFQVLISPIPGELVGAAGGYVFGWWQALLYSTVGLSLGSWINFYLARVVGRSFVERMIPPEYLTRIAYLMERQGVIASFIFFVIPGFPKDYFCYALGLSPMSARIFLVVSSLGRVPGTLLLSLQGAAVYNENYWSFFWLFLLSIAFILPVWLWRERIYQWLYRLEKGRGPLEIPPQEPPGPDQA
ncbi:MAG: TVP38/TMEM64 family protein [Desulfarculus sp.]|nr:TVP38/TMEM64 family protein [Desulfarculus sp.]